MDRLKFFGFRNVTGSIGLPGQLSAWIRVHFKEIGEPDRIQFRPCKRIPFWWIPGNRNMAALTLWSRVYLRTEHCPIDPARHASVELVLHELVHVSQFRRNPLLFPFKYLLQHVRHGYANNPAEVEARQVAAKLVSLYFRDRGGK